MSKRIKVKPGKAQSMMGFGVGIVFCLIGIFVVIPSAGLFGIFWTAMAVMITVVNAMNAFSRRGVSSHEIIIDDSDSHGAGSHGTSSYEAGGYGTGSHEAGGYEAGSYGASGYGPGSCEADSYGAGGYEAGSAQLKASIEQRLQAAEDLYVSGLITPEEYEAKRKEILEDL